MSWTWDAKPPLKKGGFCFFMGEAHHMITYVYIDGFNLYHGIIRETRTHWLNLDLFAQRLAGGPVQCIKFCTAMVSGRRDDPDKPIRQQVYHRAVSTLPNVEVIMGSFQTNKVTRPLGVCGVEPSCFARVDDCKEKGSDVNLAAHLVHDAHMQRFDQAVVVSGDSDLAEPVRIVAQELGKRVVVYNPRERKSRSLSSAATAYRSIRPAVLAQCQFPEVVPLGDGRSVERPASWAKGHTKPEVPPRIDACCSDCSLVVRAHRRPVGA